MGAPESRPTAYPGYWMNEASGVLRPAVEAYLWRETLTSVEVALLRAYFQQWIDAPVWVGPMIDVLRTEVGEIATREDIDHWLDRALDEGLDPL